MPTAAFESPVGRLQVTALDGRITRLRWSQAEVSPDAEADPLLAEAGLQLTDYFAGQLKTFDLPLAPQGSDFQLAVWRIMTGIPYGEVLTYGEVAARTEGCAQAVGSACGANPIPVIIPCHRIVASGGSLGGFSGGGGVETKRRLLLHEGALPPELPF